MYSPPHYLAGKAWRAGLILLGILGSLAVGASTLAYPSPLSPLIVIAPLAGVAIGIAWLHNPVWAIYATLFVVLLPNSLIPPSLQSLLNRSLTMAALATWLFDVVARRRQVIWTGTALLMLGFLTWGALTLLWSANLSAAMTMVQMYALRLILYLILIPNQIRSREKLNGLMNTLAVSGWLLVLVSVATILIEGYTPGTRLRVLGVNENWLGAAALVTMQGVLWQASQPSQQHSALKHWIAAMFMLLAIGVVAMSGSRGSALALLGALLAFWLWKPTRRLATRGLLILGLGAVITPFIFTTTMERFAVTRGDTLLGGREALWQATWALIVNHPLRGVGIGNAPYAMLPYVKLLRSVWGHESMAIHNPVLAIWAETGILGLLLYLAALGSAIWLFVRQYRRYRKAGATGLMPYFALVSSTFFGYMISWIKGGGMESDFTYFLMLALLVIPSQVEDVEGLESGAEIGIRDAPRGALKTEIARPRLESPQ
jgi:O-antigen ligase